MGPFDSGGVCSMAPVVYMAYSWYILGSRSIGKPLDKLSGCDPDYGGGLRVLAQHIRRCSARVVLMAWRCSFLVNCTPEPWEDPKKQNP